MAQEGHHDPLGMRPRFRNFNDWNRGHDQARVDQECVKTRSVVRRIFSLVLNFMANCALKSRASAHMRQVF
jgi:hypothetical protein